MSASSLLGRLLQTTVGRQNTPSDTQPHPRSSASDLDHRIVPVAWCAVSYQSSRNPLLRMLGRVSLLRLGLAPDLQPSDRATSSRNSLHISSHSSPCPLQPPEAVSSPPPPEAGAALCSRPWPSPHLGSARSMVRSSGAEDRRRRDARDSAREYRAALLYMGARPYHAFMRPVKQKWKVSPLFTSTAVRRLIYR